MFGSVDEESLIDNLTSKEVLARTIWGEARGEPLEGQKAIANVVLNRIKSGKTWWGNDVRSVCLKPYQFSCWNQSDPNRSKLLALTSEDQIYVECLVIAQNAIGTDFPDNTNVADSYERTGTNAYWARTLSPVATIGNHQFFKTI